MQLIPNNSDDQRTFSKVKVISILIPDCQRSRSGSLSTDI